jgi:hypothetical protein
MKQPRFRVPIYRCDRLASRGIDIEGISHIINYELPTDLDFYPIEWGDCKMENWELPHHLCIPMKMH